MRIACLQFAPQLGDIENNLNRADAILNRANPYDIDLLVLPELAFTGCNFLSSEAITPYLEHSGSGITSLWARTTALKYDCVVVVGYPEQVNVTKGGPVSRKYYNSAIAINGDGETIANYRKSFLDAHDEPWASEGPDSFFDGDIGELGNGTIGIGMDINPYQLKAPWMAWEFAYHVLHKQSNLIILLMAWSTPTDLGIYSTQAGEPDMKRLAYWISRLEPVIRAENEGEVIIVISNRCGTECDTLYAGTSCVIGVQGGEVKVYGILGRGDRNLLVVDTSEPCLYNLVAPQNGEGVKCKAATQIPSISNRDGVFGGENIQTEMIGTEPKTMSSIDTILMGNELNWPKQVACSSPSHDQTENSRPGGLSGNDGSDLGIPGRPNKPISGKSSNSPPVSKKKEQLATYSHDASSNYFIADDNIRPPIHTNFERESFQKTSGNMNGRSVMPISTENLTSFPKSTSQQDSGYPSDSPLRTSAFPTASADHPDSAYAPESASSTKVNVPWDRKPDRTYYGDEELMRIMNYGQIPKKDAEHSLDILQSAISPRYDQPRTAFPPDSAYPPESASSMKVNVPWGPQSPQMARKNLEITKFDRTTNGRQTATRAVDRGSKLRSLSLSIPNTLGSTYATESACSDSVCLESAYALPSGVSMIVNIPWEPEPEEKFYGDRELLKVMGKSSATRRDDFEQNSTVIAQPVESFTENSFDSRSWPTTEQNYDKGDVKRNGVYYPLKHKAITPGGHSPQSTSFSQRFVAPSRNLKQLDGATDSATDASRGQTASVRSNLRASPSEYYKEPDVITKRESTPFEPTVSRPLEAVESATPTIVSTAQQSVQIQNLPATLGSSPDSTQSIMFEMPLMASPNLFPGEGLISPAATTETKSSEDMQSPAINHIRFPVDQLQSPTSDWSVRNSEVPPSSPETTSSHRVHSSLIGDIIDVTESASLPAGSSSNQGSDSSRKPLFTRGVRQISPGLEGFPDHSYLQGNSALLFEELVHQPAMSAAADSAESLTKPVSPRVNPEQVTDSVCTPKDVTSVNLVRRRRSDRNSDPTTPPLAAPHRRGIFNLASFRDMLRRTINTDLAFAGL